MTSIYEEEYTKSFTLQVMFQRMILKNIELGLEEYKELLELALKKGDSYKDLVDSFRTINKQFCEFESYKNMFLSIYVAFETYLYRSFKFILEKHPSILSENQFKVKDMFDSKKLVDSELFIERVIVKELHDLFYKDFNEIFDRVKQKYSIRHEIPKELIKRLNYTRSVRNLFLHSGGIVNHIFLAKIKDSRYKIGGKIEIDGKNIDLLTAPLKECVSSFDTNLGEQFPELMTTD